MSHSILIGMPWDIPVSSIEIGWDADISRSYKKTGIVLSYGIENHDNIDNRILDSSVFFNFKFFISCEDLFGSMFSFTVFVH